MPNPHHLVFAVFAVVAASIVAVGCRAADTGAEPEAATDSPLRHAQPAWTNTAFATQAGKFTASFDVVPKQSAEDTVIGLSSAAAAAYTDLAAIVRFADSGSIDARNGGTYAAATALPYSAGTQYHVRLVVDVAAHTYSAFVTPSGGSEVALAQGYAFRAEQASATSLANLAKYNGVGNATISGLAVSSSGSGSGAGGDAGPGAGGSGADAGGGGTSSGTGTVAHGKDIDATNTGVPAGTTLTQMTGTISLATPGQVWSGVDLTGEVDVTADNVTVKNCKIRSTGYFAVRNMGGKNLTVENCEIYAVDGPQYTAIVGDDITARRNDIYGFENGFAIGSSSLIVENYIHGLYFGPGRHVDGIEWGGSGNDTTVLRNHIVLDGGETGCVNITPYNGGTANSNTVQDNLFYGGSYSLYIRGDGGGSVNGVNVTGNVWVKSSAAYGPVSIVAATNITWTNNSYDDGTPIPQ